MFAGYAVTPKRISGMLVVSRQLLVQQTGPELDRILIGGLSRQLASYLDQVALYGTGPTGNQPQGLLGMSGVSKDVPLDTANLYQSFCAVEAQIEAANVSMDSYGVIVAPATRELLRSTPSFPGGSITTWAEIRGGQSSPEVTGGRAYCGCWGNLTFLFVGSRG